MATDIHTMNTETDGRLALARLLQLVSPSLPIGAYSYSQGIEWAVEAGWIKTSEDLRQWMLGLTETSMQYLDLPVLKRMLVAWQSLNIDQLESWNDFLIASRETNSAVKLSVSFWYRSNLKHWNTGRLLKNHR